MAIQNRRGDYTKFDKAKLVPGEIAVVTGGDPAASDGKAVYAAFSAGDTKRMATYEDMQENMEAAAGEVVDAEVARQCGVAIQACKTATANTNAAISNADAAAGAANTAKVNADKATTIATNAAAAAEEAAEKAEAAATALDTGWVELYDIPGGDFKTDTANPLRARRINNVVYVTGAVVAVRAIENAAERKITGFNNNSAFRGDANHKVEIPSTVTSGNNTAMQVVFTITTGSMCTLSIRVPAANPYGTLPAEERILINLQYC